MKIGFFYFFQINFKNADFLIDFLINCIESFINNKSTIEQIDYKI